MCGTQCVNVLMGGSVFCLLEMVVGAASILAGSRRGGLDGPSWPQRPALGWGAGRSGQAAGLSPALLGASGAREAEWGAHRPGQQSLLWGSEEPTYVWSIPVWRDLRVIPERASPKSPANERPQDNVSEQLH